LSRTSALSGVIEHLRVWSSKWGKTQGVAKFSWQRGYGAFSISQSQVADVISYIEKQEEHHQKRTFQEEYRLFLKRYRLAFIRALVPEEFGNALLKGIGQLPSGIDIDQLIECRHA
jgi:hypothetical protein